jgi:hypothetical protein
VEVAQAVKALAARHTARTIGEAAGVSPQMVYHWLKRGQVPDIERAVRIDEALGAPGLVAAVTKARTRRCARRWEETAPDGTVTKKRCRKTFLTRGKATVTKYCSTQCRAAVHREGQRRFYASLEPSRQRHINLLTSQLRTERMYRKRLRDVVDGFCAICPEGAVCGNGECPGHGVTRVPCVVGGCPVKHRRTAA